ncbi:MAG: hypothetical protein V1672_02940 [Candidatus Diapherotrites archaeon]
MRKGLIVLTLLGFLLFGCLQNAPEKSTDEKISEVFKIMSEKYPKDEIPQITLIENADELKSQQQVIYKNAENGMFIVQWPDLLVIYDYENQEVVQELAITNVNLG